MRQVHWYQGQFVRPHHFQAADFFSDELQRTSHRWDHPYNYGLHRFAYSKDSLAAKRFLVTELAARTRAGTLVSLEPRQELTIDLSEALDHAGSVDVYLGIPNLNPGAENVSAEGQNGFARYCRCEEPWKDETGWSADTKIEVRKLSLKLLVRETGASAPASYETLRVARILRAGQDSTQPQWDPDYIPSVLAIDGGWPDLRRGFVEDIRSRLEARIAELSVDVRKLRIGENLEPTDWGRTLLLDRLNEASTVLGLLQAAAGVHPFTAYAELARIVGALSIFTPARSAIGVLDYDHDDLGRIFIDIYEKIQVNLDPVHPPYLRENFVGDGPTMKVTLGPEWFDAEWQWYIGVEREPELSEADLRRLLEGGHGWYWTHASRPKVEEFYRPPPQQGLRLELKTESVPDLPSRRRWSYYAVSQDPHQSPAWPDIHSTLTVAMRVKGHDDLDGKEHLDHVMMDDQGRIARRIRLRFSLFAARK